MFNLGIVKVNEARTITADSIRREYYFVFADGDSGMLFVDGEVRFSIKTETK